MRIYKSDGSFVENPYDTEFGWNLRDIAIDESVVNYEKQNQEIKAMAALRRAFKISANDLEESVDLSSFEIIDKKPTRKINRIEPRIKIQEAASVIEPKIENEGLTTIKEGEEVLKFESIDAKIPSKLQMASLINPCSVESKMLLSVIYYAKYKNLVKDVINLGDIRGSSKIKFLIGQKSEDIEDNLRKEIKHYHETKEDNMLSIMMELILRDTNSDMDEITECKSAHNVESSDLGNSILSDSDSGGSQEMSSLNRYENQYRSEFLSSIGLSDVIDRSLEKICEETYDLHINIAEIRKSLLEEEVRVNALIDESQAFERNLRGTKYLDDLINLLNGKLDKIQLKKSPFRIFNPTSNAGEQNLII